MSELDGKVAIVTGAGRMRGMGRAAAVALAKLGADVVVTGTGRNPATYPPDERVAGWKDVESTAEQVRAMERRALPLVVDVTDADQVQTMVDRAVEELGGADILVNNAAYPIGADRAPIVDVDPEVFRRVVDIKVTGTYLCTQAFLKAAGRRRGGKIVNVASAEGKRGKANTLAYNAANFAMVGMTQSMALELGPLGINVNCVCPGPTMTARMDVIAPEEIERRTATTPIGRLGTDEEMGGFIAYLCTEAASWIHGQSININGGLVMEH